MSPTVLTVTEEKVALLRAAMEVVMCEHTAITNKNWDDMAALGRRKQELAEQMNEFEWMPGPDDRKSVELMMLTAQVVDLEYQCRKKIQTEILINRTQLAALKRKHQEWLSCLQTYHVHATMD